MSIPTLNLANANSTHAFIKQLYIKLFGISTQYPAGTDRTGVCGGNLAVTPGVATFDHPSFIECTGNDGTINYTDEYGNEVAGYPMTAGKTTNFRVSKVTAATATGLYRCYSK